MDQFDIKIVKRLEADGRVPFSTIAAELGISNTMVHQRVNKMIEHGIIKGIRPVLDEKKMGFEWGSFTGLTLEKDHDTNRIIAALEAIPEVSECYFITGSYTLYLRILAKSNEHMRSILYDRIDNIPGVAKTNSIIELGCAFRRNVIL